MQQDLIINWNVDTTRIDNICENIIKETKDRFSKILNSSSRDIHLLHSLNELEILFSNEYGFINILKNVHPKSEIRDKCKKAQVELNKLLIEIAMNRDLFDLLQSIDLNQLDNESKRYVVRSIQEKKLDGLHLDQTIRDSVRNLKEKISFLSFKFLNNLIEESTELKFSLEQLNGVNENLLNSLLRNNESGQYVVTLKYPIYFPILKECKVPETRRKLKIAFDKRCINENTIILDELLSLRNQLANKLGFENYAQYKIKLQCAKNPQNVDEFLEKIIESLRILQKKEYEILLDYKKKDCEELNLEFDGEIKPSDLKYYINLRLIKEYEINQSKIKEYFPLDNVLNGIFKIYEQLFDLKIDEIKEPFVYHKEIRLFRINCLQTNEILGHFYTDLHPREGKYGHAENFPVIRGCLNGKQKSVCVVVCNFTSSTDDTPSLLSHEEVEVLIHELGHVMHHMCSKTFYHKFSGTHVEVDFLETPSQMFENWIWEKEPLKMMSCHYKNSSSIDDQTLENLIKSKNISNGCMNIYYAMLSKLDLHFHLNENVNTAKAYQDLMKEFMLCELEEKDANFSSSFGHIANGYDSLYYSYLWSKIYSQDMFHTRFLKEGILNKNTGLDYRKKILEPGGSIDGEQMVINFLGRNPSMESFLKEK